MTGGLGAGGVLQLQLLVSHRVHTRFLPLREVVPFAQADRGSVSAALRRDELEHLRQFRRGHRPFERERTQLVVVEALCEIGEDRVLRVGCGTLDDELSSGHSDGNRRAIDEEVRQPLHDVPEHGLVRRVAHGIPRVAMNSNRELDQELRQRLGERRRLIEFFGCGLGQREPGEVSVGGSEDAFPPDFMRRSPRRQ